MSIRIQNGFYKSRHDTPREPHRYHCTSWDRKILQFHLGLRFTLHGCISSDAINSLFNTMNTSRLNPFRALCLPCFVALSLSYAVAPSTQHQVSITTDGDYRFIKSNGWPDHEPGQFPRKGNPNSASPQSYTFRVPLKPTLATEPSRVFGWWGVALNGVPFEPGTAETWQNNPQSGWRYEAATGFLNLGLDEHNAHVQPTGAYHYHAMPVGLVERLGGDDQKMLLIGYAADGFPIYTSKAYDKASDAKSVIRVMKSSYTLKAGPRPAQEGGPGGNYDGRFTQDWEYVAGSGDLDETNGRTGLTPEYPEGTYYYCLTPEFPFVPRQWKGVPDQSFAKHGGGPPGGPGRRGGPGGRPPEGDPLRGTFLPDFP
jgi:hypothetical protein